MSITSTRSRGDDLNKIRGDAMHWHYPLALAAPLGCFLAILGLLAVSGAVRIVAGRCYSACNFGSDAMLVHP
jgi:hypothetical protein